LYKGLYNISKFLLLFFCVFCLLSLTKIEAATVRINPTKVRLIIPPGESKSGIIEVENPSEEAAIVKVYLQDWAYTSLLNGTKEFYPAGTTAFSCADWIGFSLSEFVIPAYGRQRLNYTVKVPADAEGGHYAVLFFESLLQETKVKKFTDLGVVVRIGTLFYIEPEGTIKRWAEVKGLTLENRRKDNALGISLDFNNIGNVDITCKGTFHLMDKSGMVAARGEFNDIYSLPGEKAKLTAVWPEALLKGKYDLIVTVDIGKSLEEAGLGRGPVITKETEIEIDDNGQAIRVGELK